jgi:hypothetical protein
MFYYCFCVAEGSEHETCIARISSHVMLKVFTTGFISENVLPKL